MRNSGKAANFILGKAVAELETELANYLGVKHAIAVSSGTDALVLALKAAGIQPEDSVLVPNFTFYATVEAVSLVGAKPKFVDIESRNFNLCPKHLELMHDASCKAILPVHLFGAPAQMNEICNFANRHELTVIEDAAQAFGAKFHGNRVGSIGDLGCFSFYPTKVLGAFGDGGLVTTNNDELAVQVRLLRNHGIVGPNQHQIVGYCSRLNPVQAVLLKLKLKAVDLKIKRRRLLAQRYIDNLQDLELGLPREFADEKHVFNIFTVRTKLRENIASALREHKVGHQIYYPMPVHKQLPYQPAQCS